ncbi:hypothetical protein GEMRC1_000852 [Eukaryota sp. GEM-RC1]
MYTSHSYPTFAPWTVPDFGIHSSFKIDFSSSTTSFNSFPYHEPPVKWHIQNLPYRVISPSPNVPSFMSHYTREIYGPKVKANTIDLALSSSKSFLKTHLPSLLIPEPSLDSLVKEDLFHSPPNFQLSQSVLHPLSTSTFLIWTAGDDLSSIHLTDLFKPEYSEETKELFLTRPIIPNIPNSLGLRTPGVINNLKAHNVTSYTMGVSSASRFGLSFSLFDCRGFFSSDRKSKSNLIADFSTNDVICDISTSPVKGSLTTSAILIDGTDVSSSERKANHDVITRSESRGSINRISWLGHPFQLLSSLNNELYHSDIRTKSSNSIYTTSDVSFTSLSTPDCQSNPFSFWASDYFFYYSFDLRFTRTPLFQWNHPFPITAPIKWIDFCPQSNLITIANQQKSLILPFNSSFSELVQLPFTVPLFQRPPQEILANNLIKFENLPECSGVSISKFGDDVVIGQSSTTGHVFLSTLSKKRSNTPLTTTSSLQSKEHGIVLEEVFKPGPEEISKFEIIDLSQVSEEISKKKPNFIIDGDLINRISNSLISFNSKVVIWLSNCPRSLLEYVNWFQSSFSIVVDADLLLKLTEKYVANLKIWNISDTLNIVEIVDFESKELIDAACVVIYVENSDTNPLKIHESLNNENWWQVQNDSGSIIDSSELENRKKFINELKSRWNVENSTEILNSSLSVTTSSGRNSLEYAKRVSQKKRKPVQPSKSWQDKVNPRHKDVEVEDPDIKDEKSDFIKNEYFKSVKILRIPLAK